MSSTSFTLSCPKHSTFFLDTLWNFYQEKYKVDIEIRSKRQAIFAHQIVLSIFCTKLRTDLDSDSVLTDKLININEVTFDDDLLEVLLEFMYKGEVSIEESKLTDLKKAAISLGIDGLLHAIDDVSKDKNEEIVIPKKNGARRRKPAKPIRTPVIDDNDDETDSDHYNEVEETENSEDDWSPDTKRHKCKHVKKAKASVDEARVVGVEASNLKNASSSGNGGTVSNQEDPIPLHNNGSEIRTCPICGKEFRNPPSYRRHMMCHTNDPRLHRCDQCQFRSANKSDLIEHLGSVHMVDLKGNPLSEIKCEQCDYKCFTKQRLKQHILRRHTEKMHKCDRCDYSAVVLYDLLQHIRGHHDNVHAYQCDTCGKRFNRTSSLNRHLLCHSGVKPYKCEICGQDFARTGSLKFHMMKHQGDERPYVCEICGKCCRRKDNLQMHMRRIHKTNDMSGTSLNSTDNSKSTENSMDDSTSTIANSASEISEFMDISFVEKCSTSD